MELEGGIVVGVLGQWASGKSEAARTLVRHLGGEAEVVFLTDRALFAGRVASHILELEDSEVEVSTDDDGRQRLEGKLATVWLNPGEDLATIDLSTLDFKVYDDQVLYTWRNRAKVELGYQIRERSAEGKRIVIETAFGPNIEPNNPFGRTISDLFTRLEDAGVDTSLVKWIIIEAGYDKRAVRNEKRKDKIPDDYFEKFGADGGDLEPELQKRLEERGTRIIRVSNEHDDIERFRAEIIAAVEKMAGET